MVEEESTIRITLRLPIDTKDELYEMCTRFGLRPGNVFPTALMIGMRVLGRSFSLAETRELWDSLTAASQKNKDSSDD
jgi:hypothetical protein